MRTMLRGLAATALAILMSTTADAKTVTFGIIATETSQSLKTIWEPYLEAMEKSTGLEVKPFFASDYAGVIEGMRFGKVDVAWYGNKSALEAVDRAGGEIFAQTVDVEGNPGYWSLLITSIDSPLEKLDDVLKCDKSLNFGLGDPNSTSGFLVPTTFVYAQRGIDPKKCYKRVTNASHEVNALSVANKKVDFATNNTESMRRLEVTNPAARAKIKEIWRSPLIPSDPLVWHKDLDRGSKDKIYTFVMSYGRMGAPEDVAKAREILAGLDWAPLKPSSNAQLYPIRVLEISKEINKTLVNDALSEAEKKAKIAELNIEKAKYEKLMDTIPQS